MRELSLHILDIAENSTRANATTVHIIIDVQPIEDKLEVVIEDNGKGMSEEMARNVLDPFVTTRKTRRVGMGLPLFKAAAERCAGEFELESTEGEGTRIRATFQLSHIDRAPMGDIAGTLITLIQGNQEIDFIFTYRYGDQDYHLSTKMLRAELGELPLNHPEVLDFIERDFSSWLEDIPMEF